jgi:Secretory pathway protein Sec39
MAEGASPSPQQLSDPAILLLAANLASIPDLSSLNALVAQYPDVLNLTSMLQVLLKVLPETTLPEDYLGIVYRLSRPESEPLSSYQIPTSYIHEIARLSQKSIRSKLADFNLELPTSSHEDIQQALVQWFFDRARRIEQETGMIELARRLVLPNQNEFNQDPPFPPSPVTIWGNGVLKVLERFIFENNDEDELQLSAFENLDPESAVRLLLSRTTPDTISRTFRELVKPFITYKHVDQGENLWATVWEWFLDRVADGDLSYVANLAQAWNEEDGELVKGFLTTCLAACYLCHKSSSKVRSDLHRIDNFLSRFSAYFEPGGDIRLTHPETDFLSSELRNSPLTALTISALQFLNAMIISADIVAQLTSPSLSLKELAIIHEESAQTQTQLAERLLRGDPNRPRRTDEQWKSLRQSLKQLRNQTGILGKLSEESLDTMVFVCMLDACGISQT